MGVKRRRRKVKRVATKKRGKTLPFKLIATKRNEDLPWKVEEHSFDGNFKFRAKVGEKEFIISINEINNCLQVECTNRNTYIQPMSTASFLIK
jgi:hypothetical protein